jgi:hypothetical protein
MERSGDRDLTHARQAIVNLVPGGGRAPRGIGWAYWSAELRELVDGKAPKSLGGTNRGEQAEGTSGADGCYLAVVAE